MAALDPTSTPAPATAGNIRTFLIADVRGYTAYTVEHGDEAAAQLAGHFADVVEEIVRARDGRVVELRGDEALVVFASARQALRAAVDLQARLAEDKRRDPTHGLNIGVGLDAGEAVPVRDGFRGAALNMAARLCSLAGPGEILASDSVAHLARKLDEIAYVERGLVQLKGFSDPVRVIRIESTVANGSAHDAPEGAPATAVPHVSDTSITHDLPFGGFLGALPVSPIVAREHDLARVLAVVDAVEAGTGRLVFISGEPGVGKTRLAQEITLNVRNRGFAIAVGRCYEAHQNVPFYPFIEALSGAYAAAPSVVRAELPRRWPDLARLLPSLEIPLADTTGNQDQQRLFWAVTGLLQALAAVQPVALLLDDLHWTDVASMELLQHLARHTRRHPVLLVGSFRAVEIHHHHPLESALRDLQREELVDRIDLKGLERGGTSALMAASMGEEEISDDFAELVYQRTEGNPFFVQQVMRALVERGDIFRRDGHWDRKQLEDIDVPESIRSVVSQRLSRLSELTQDIVNEASVLGQSFHFDDVQGMTARSEQDIENALTEASKSGLMRETGRDLFSFDHALTQQSLYGELTTRRRRRLHFAAGEALESLPVRRREERAVELAWHFLEGDDSARALPWSLKAGVAAMAVFAYRDAEMHFRTARELARELGEAEQEVEALQKLGDALLSLSRLDEGLEVLEAASILYRNLGDAKGEMRVVARLGWVHGQRGTRQEGIDRLRLVLMSAPKTTSPGLIELQVELARLYSFEGRNEEALETADEATTRARSLGDDRLRARAQSRRASILTYFSRSSEALDEYREALVLAERSNDLYTVEITLNNLFGEYMKQFRPEEADAIQLRQLDVVRQKGEPASIAWVLGQIAYLARARGRFIEALNAFTEAAEISRSIGPHRGSGALAGVSSIRLFMGDHTALEDLMKSSQSSIFPERLYAQFDLALWDVLHDRPADALARVQRVSSNPMLEHQDRLFVNRWTARALVGLGEIREAEAMAAKGMVEADKSDLGPLPSMWRRVLMEVRVAQGRLAEARDFRDQALSRIRKLGVVFEEAQALFEFGSALARHGDDDDARKALQESLTLFRQIDSPPFIAKIEELLEGLPQT